jgi:hypothetical protein
MNRAKAEYLCEIASVIWSMNNWLDIKQIPKENRTEILYEDWFCFYEYVYDICNKSERKCSLLEIIYDEIGGNLMTMFADFLSTYKVDDTCDIC